MEIRKKHLRLIGFLLLLLAILFWLYVAAWLNYVKPLFEFTELAMNSDTFNVFSECETLIFVAIKFAILTFISIFMGLMGINLIKTK